MLGISDDESLDEEGKSSASPRDNNIVFQIGGAPKKKRKTSEKVQSFENKIDRLRQIEAEAELLKLRLSKDKFKNNVFTDVSNRLENIDAEMKANLALCRDKMFGRLSNEAIESFIEDMGEGGGNNTNFRFSQLAEQLFADVYADLSMIQALAKSSEKSLPRLVEQVIVQCFADNTGYVSWKNFAKYLNSITIARMKASENTNRRDATTSTPRDGGGGAGGNDEDDDDDDDDDYPAADDDAEMIPVEKAKKSGKGKGKRKKETPRTTTV